MSITQILSLVGCLVFGLIIGGVYFTVMWWSAELFASGGRVPLAITLVAGRFALIVTVLALIATQGGALPLLITALGVVIARLIAVWRVKALTS
jgi:F1F0 ATPase subunit 2